MQIVESITILIVLLLVAVLGAPLAKRFGFLFSRGYQAIIFWGGLRGAVVVALALSIPLERSTGTQFSPLRMGLFYLHFLFKRLRSHLL